MGENKKKEKLVILFNGAHLAYSPTVIGLYDFLLPQADVTIIALSPLHFNGQQLLNRNVVYYKGQPDKESIVDKIRFIILGFFNKEVTGFKKEGKGANEFFYVFKPVKQLLKKLNPKHIIAVDFANLFYCQLLSKNAEFLSLEIKPEDKFSPQKKLSNINSVIIQTPERYKYIFDNRQFRTFYIQNAPVYKEIAEEKKREGLVYCGTAWDAFGFYHCLNFLRAFPGEKMTVKGALPAADRKRVYEEYDDLINEQRLIIDNTYTDEAEIISYLKQFRIGFCFYNFSRPEINTFNYQTAPAGKLFKYLAAGIPVVAQKSPGMHLVEQHKCGILIHDLTPALIYDAISQIEKNYNSFSINCYAAARQYSFDNSVTPFVRYLFPQFDI